MSEAYTLYLDKNSCHALLKRFGPSLALWRAAEIAVLREIRYQHPILDVGCGDGLVTSMVLDYVDIGLDPDAQALKKASMLACYKRFEVTSVQHTTIASESIATVLSNSVLEHIPEIDAVLTTIARVLQPGGKIIFTTPTPTFSTWLFLPLRAYAQWRNGTLHHLNMWTPNEWRHRLEMVGLEVESVRPYLHREQVWLWDALELLQHVWIGKQRLFSLFWKRLPDTWLDKLAEHMAHWNLADSDAGGGQLIIARKPHL